MQTYARVAGILFLISMVAGFFGEFYAPSRLIVSHDAAATAKNIVAFNSPRSSGSSLLRSSLSPSSFTLDLRSFWVGLIT